MALKVMNAVLAGGDPAEHGQKKRDKKFKEKKRMKTWKEVQKMEASMERKQKVNLGVLKQETKPQTVAITNTDSNSVANVVTEVFNPSLRTFKGETPYVAVDCEMVGVENNNDALARVSIVNYNGHVLYDKYVRPSSYITDFRTWVSGITPAQLKESNGAITFEQAKKESHRILKDKVIVGHSLHHDFKALDYPMEDGENKRIRDLSHYPKYKNNIGQTRSLKKLTADFLGREIQQGQHNSVIDARASIALYRINEKDWENYAKQR